MFSTKRFLNSTVLGLTIGVFLAGYAAFWIFNKSENFPAEVEAGVSHNVSGFAWSENIGWISFNCTDQGTCGSVNYGVHVNNLTGAFSGFAWSENIGWIQFDPAGPYPSEPNSSAKLNAGNNEVSGWARAVANGGGWDGWIKMRGTAPDYGVSWNSGTKEFAGFAWGSDVIGWISFNCADLGVCATSNYKVIANINSPPSASGLSATKGDYCTVPSHAFSWIFSDLEDGSTQTSYNLEVAKNSSFSPAEIQASGTAAKTRQFNVKVSPAAGVDLAYNTEYFWRVKTFDSAGADSGWITGASFTTEPHLYPTSNFTFAPSTPSQGEQVLFSESAQCFDTANNAIACPVANTNYSWDFHFETPPFTQEATGHTATTTYNDTATHTIALDVTDADSKTCRNEKPLVPKSPLPKFKETAPR